MGIAAAATAHAVPAATAAIAAAAAATAACDPPCEVPSAATVAMELAAMPPAAQAELMAVGAASPPLRDRYLAVPGRMGAADCISAADLSATLSSSSASAPQVRLHGGVAAAYPRRRPSTGIMSTI